MTSRIDGVESKCEFITAKCAVEKSVAIVGVRNVHGDLVVPAELGGFSVVGIRNSAFQGCTALKSVEIPDSVTSIGDRAFSGCEELKCVILPKRLTRIENYTFSECINLESVTIPDGLASIEEGAFYECYGLTDMMIPASVTCIEEGAFGACGNLNSFSVAENNQSYKVESGMLLTKDGKILIRGVSGNVTIPDGVAKIGKDAFSHLDITGITIPSSVKCIGSGAFFCCNKLKSLAIPDSVTSIGNGAFRRCRGLMDVAIPSGVEIIGRFAFEECISLASVAMPSSVERIGYGAFNDTPLKTICISPGDSGRIKKLLEDSGHKHKIRGIKFVEREADVQ